MCKVSFEGKSVLATAVSSGPVSRRSGGTRIERSLVAVMPIWTPCSAGELRGEASNLFLTRQADRVPKCGQTMSPCMQGFSNLPKTKLARARKLTLAAM